jgi:AcrR family transcriptional regulator
MKPKKTGRKLPAKTSRRGPSQKAQRLEQILGAAFQVFGAHGYEATRIDEVARQAGIAKGTIYLYFKGKDQLFRAVVRSLIQNPFPQTANLPGPSETVLRQLFTRMYTQVVRSEKARSIIRLLIAESGKFPQLADIYHREVIAPGLKALRQIVMCGIERGEFRKTSAVEFPQLLVGPGILAIVFKLLHGERYPLDLDAYMKAHIDFVLSSLRKKV